ncbi:MAG: restriction endonuclease subunit S [Bacterioplanes sp.]|nr:restriction endonuclease subunit S [Bacterioplanes sp.]
MSTTLLNNVDLWTSAVHHKSTAGRGSNRKLELAGINKLRELILELAVRGKLVPQNPDDEPASELLKRIEAEKAQLIKDGKLKKQKPLTPVTDEEKPFELPQGWEWSRLGAISVANTGYAFKSSQYTEKGTFVLRVTNISTDGKINSSDAKYICEQSANSEYKNFSLEAGDVLLVMVGGSLGKIGIVGADVLPAVLNQNMWKMQRFGGIEKDYFVSMLRFVNENQVTITNSTHGHLSQGEYLSKLAPLPPLAEQQRIVAKVDELMALCDQLGQQSEHQLDAHQQLTETLLATLTNATSAQELSDNWQRLAQHFDLLFSGPMGTWAIDRLKDTILQLAVMGKLVPQNPDDEPAAELLKRIDAEKARLVKEGKIKKPKPLPPVSNDEKPFELPQRWEWARLSQILPKITDGTHHSPTNTETGDFLYISAKNIKNEGVLLSNATYVTKEVHEEIFARCDPEFGDILYIKDGATTGIATINNLTIPFSMLSSVALLKVLPKLNNNQFILNTLRSPLFYQAMREGMTGVAITRVTLKKLELATLPLPPLAEQQRIVAKVDELFALCDQLKERLQQASDTQLNLTDAIVEKALNS